MFSSCCASSKCCLRGPQRIGREAQYAEGTGRRARDVLGIHGCFDGFEVFEIYNHTQHHDYAAANQDNGGDGGGGIRGLQSD
jgi:hypothetical protein